MRACPARSLCDFFTHKVIIGDYFQWGAHLGSCGNSTDANKGFLIYTAFSWSSYDGTDQSSVFDFIKSAIFESLHAPYYFERISDHVEVSNYTKYTKTKDITSMPRTRPKMQGNSMNTVKAIRMSRQMPCCSSPLPANVRPA